MSTLRSAILLISTPPEQWRPEKASSLGGVIVVPQDVTPADLDVLKTRNLPYLTFTESALPVPRIMLGQRKAAKHMTEQLLRLGHRRIAILSGFDETLDATKRIGVHEGAARGRPRPGAALRILRPWGTRRRFSKLIPLRTGTAPAPHGGHRVR